MSKLHDRIKEEVLDGILSMFSENDSVEMAAGYIADAVIRELEAGYVLVPHSNFTPRAIHVITPQGNDDDWDF